jgi:hypothetical protein
MSIWHYGSIFNGHGYGLSYLIIGGRSIRTIEEALKHVYPDWETVGMDYDHCYACIPRFKHPKGACYTAGHFADTRQYYGF